MDKVIRRRVEELLERIELIHDNQHHFRERSSVTNLLEFYEQVTEVRQKRAGWVNSIFMDYKKVST